MNHRFFHLTRVTLLLPLALFLLGAPVRAAPFFSFDPAACDEDPDGKVIVRLPSGLAFAVPYEGLVLSEAGSDNPDAAEVTLGCPGNPVRTSTFRFSPEYLALLEGRLDPPYSGGAIYDLSVIGSNVSVSQQRWRIEFIDEIGARTRNCGATAEGVRYCLACREDSARPGHCVMAPDAGTSSDGRDLDRAAMVLVDPENLTGPDNLPWATDCWREEDNGTRFCNAAYPVMDGLSIAYTFLAEGFDRDRVREFDLDIRREVLGLRASEYDGDDMR